MVKLRSSDKCTHANACFNTLNFIRAQRKGYAAAGFCFAPNFIIAGFQLCTQVAAIADIANQRIIGMNIIVNTTAKHRTWPIDINFPFSFGWRRHFGKVAAGCAAGG